nr:uncharacterized protein C11orf52 homolog isoform X5 [Pelodiscus sinensis]|eukprot:XP_025039495.1 uncharacterized protein C11orf52 homolog isoform X5 [Pelodiscus sinensis]
MDRHRGSDPASQKSGGKGTTIHKSDLHPPLAHAPRNLRFTSDVPCGSPSLPRTQRQSESMSSLCAGISHPEKAAASRSYWERQSRAVLHLLKEKKKSKALE